MNSVSNFNERHIDNIISLIAIAADPFDLPDNQRMAGGPRSSIDLVTRWPPPMQCPVPIKAPWTTTTPSDTQHTTSCITRTFACKSVSYVCFALLRFFKTLVVINLPLPLLPSIAALSWRSSTLATTYGIKIIGQPTPSASDNDWIAVQQTSPATWHRDFVCGCLPYWLLHVIIYSMCVHWTVPPLLLRDKPISDCRYRPRPCKDLPATGLDDDMQRVH